MNTVARSYKKKNYKINPNSKLKDLYSYKVPNIVIVGDKEIRRKISRMEKDFNILLIFSEPEKISEYINEKTIALIVDAKKIKEKEISYLKKLFKDYSGIPTFYLAREHKKSNFYTSLYNQGLQGVINWPDESQILHNLIIESLRPHPKAYGSSKADEKLSKIIKSHLVLNGSYKSVKVNVIDGFAFLEGFVKSLNDKKIIETECNKVLGVKMTIIKNIRIKKTPKVTDKELERKIKMYIGNILNEKKRAVSVKVKNKVVTLLGVTSNHSHVLDIEEFVMRQPGVQEIMRRIKYRPSLVAKNVKKAKVLEEKIKTLFEGVKFISINIYGEYAEVSGTVKMRTDTILVERYLLQILPIKRVVNKLFVSKAL